MGLVVGVSDPFDTVVEETIFDLAPPSADSALPAAAGGWVTPVIETEDDLEAFLWDTFQVRISKHECCPDKGHTSPWKAFCYAFFARGPVCIWKASRGFGGKSYMLSLLAQTEAITLRADVKILGGSGEQARRVLKYTEDLWTLPTAPTHLLDGEPGSRSTKLTTGNTIEALMASTTSVRGPHPQRLRMDEIDEMKLKILNAAAGQTMSKGWVMSNTVLSSTHHYPQGTFTAKLQEAADKGWPVFEWCYRANLESNGGWLPDAEVERKRIEVPAQMWDVEYEGQEPSAEGRAIDTEAVKRMFEQRGDLEPEPEPGHLYGTGGDWARKVNHTVIITLKRSVKPIKLVWIKRGQRRPWPTMIGWFKDQWQRFGGTNRHDRTGLGDVVHDFAGVSEDDGVIMVGRDRQDLLSEWFTAIENGEVWVPWPDPTDDSEEARAIRVMAKEHEYITVDDAYGKGKLPDTVSAGALAYRACKGVIAAGAVKDPEPPEGGSPLQQGFQRGRLSGFNRGPLTRRPR